MLDYLNQMVETLKNLSLEMKLLIGVCLLVLVGALFYKYRTSEIEESFFDDSVVETETLDNDVKDEEKFTDHLPPTGVLNPEPDEAASVQEEAPPVQEEEKEHFVEAFDGDAPAFESFAECGKDHEKDDE